MEREAITKKLAALASRLQELDLEDARDTTTTANEATAKESPLAPGIQVEITARDKYHGRRGCIESRRGFLFWNVRLDPLVGETRGCLIYKKDKFLRPL